MAAPAGVNEGIPADPAKAGAAGAALTGAPAAEATPAEIVPPPAEPVEGELAATAPAEEGAATGDTAAGDTAAGDTAAGDTAAGDTAAGDLAEAAPTETAPTETAPTETAPTETAPPDGEHVEGGLAEEGLAEEGLADDGLAGEGADGPAPDAAEEKRNVSPLAVAGIIIVILAMVGVAAGVLAEITHGFRPKTVITYRPAAVFRLRPGECVNLGASALDVTVVSCSTPHDAEVFATFSLPETSWPGASAAQQDASNGCASRLSGYLNPQLATADLTQEFVYPNQAAWLAGEHTVVCEVRAASGPLTGSVRANS
jgi:Septum formation